MAVKKQEVSLGEENWTMEIRPKASFFQFLLPPHFNKKIVTVQYFHSYTLRDVQNSLSICFLVIKNSGQTNYFVCPAVFALLQVIIMRLPARINY